MLMRKLKMLTLSLAIAGSVVPASGVCRAGRCRRGGRHTAARTADNVKLDEGRKPAEVLSFFGLEPGMQVIDMFGANKYWAEIMAPAVGPKGQRHRVAADAVPQRQAPRRLSPRSRRSSRTSS